MEFDTSYTRNKLDGLLYDQSTILKGIKVSIKRRVGVILLCNKIQNIFVKDQHLLFKKLLYRLTGYYLVISNGSMSQPGSDIASKVRYIGTTTEKYLVLILG